MAKTRTELVHCDNCGEDYAATYRRCPFCNAKPGGRASAAAPTGVYEDTYYDEEPARRRGGKRLAGGKPPRQGGDGQILRTVLYLLSALVIVAAVWILCTKVMPKFLREPQPTPSQEQSVAPSVLPSPSAPVAPSPSWEPLPVVDPALTDDPLSLDSPDLPSVEPDPVVSQPPVAVTQAPATAAAGSLSLSSTDFTMSPRYPTYQMEITGVGRSQATYSIANEKVATVSSTGLITAVGNGTTTLTVTDKSGNSATAIVRVSGMSGQTAQSSAAPSATQSSGGAKATLSTTDFTLSQSLGYTARLTVQGGTAASWASSDESVATVSSNGTVTGHNKGTARITCTLDDGTTLRAIVRVN